MQTHRFQILMRVVIKIFLQLLLVDDVHVSVVDS